MIKVPTWMRNGLLKSHPSLGRACQLEAPEVGLIGFPEAWIPERVSSLQEVFLYLCTYRPHSIYSVSFFLLKHMKREKWEAETKDELERRKWG